MKKRLPPWCCSSSSPPAAATYLYTRPPAALVLTGIVTTNDVVVSPQIGGQISQLLVAEGDVVKKDQLLAVITPDELQRRERLLRAERRRPDVAGPGKRSGAALPGAPDHRPDPAGRIDAGGDRVAGERGRSRPRERAPDLHAHARICRNRAWSRRRSSIRRGPRRTRRRRKLDALKRQVEAQRAAVALARSTAEQTAVRRSQVRPASISRRRPTRSARRPTSVSPTPR